MHPSLVTLIANITVSYHVLHVYFSSYIKNEKNVTEWSSETLLNVYVWTCLITHVVTLITFVNYIPGWAAFRHLVSHRLLVDAAFHQEAEPRKQLGAIRHIDQTRRRRVTCMQVGL